MNILLFRRGHAVDIAIHARASAYYNHTRVSTAYGTMGRFPTDTLMYYIMRMPVHIRDDDPFPLRSTLLSDTRGRPPFFFLKKK